MDFKGCSQEFARNKENFPMILEAIQTILPNVHIVLVYFCGSMATNSFIDGISDVDVLVVVDNVEGCFHGSYDGVDFYLKGINDYLKWCSCSPDMILRNSSAADTCLDFEKNLVYADPEIDTVYFYLKEAIKKFDVIKFIKICYNLYIGDNGIDLHRRKYLYHMFRLCCILKRYEQTGVYSLDLTEKERNIIVEYKINFRNARGDEMLTEYIVPAVAYIKAYLDNLPKVVEI